MITPFLQKQWWWFLYSIVTVDGIWAHCSEKPVTWLSSPHFSQKHKIQDWSFHWKMYAHHFLEIQRYHSPGVHGNKRLKQWISCVHWGKMPMLLQHDNAITHTSDATSAVIESIRFWICFTTSLLPGIGFIWLLVICCSPTTSQRNSFNMWWSTSSYKDVVSRSAWRVLQQLVGKSCFFFSCVVLKYGD